MVPAEPDSGDGQQPQAASEESRAPYANEAGSEMDGPTPDRADPDSRSEPSPSLSSSDGFGVRLAPPWLRLVAFVGDAFFFAILFSVGLLLYKFVRGPTWVLSVTAGLAFIYYITMTAWLMDGQTLGKAICGLTVRHIDGTLPTRSWRDLAWSLGRHSVGYLIADVLFLGTVASLFTPRRRCLHDYAFGSEVVWVAGREEATSFWEQYRAYMQLLSERHGELGKQTRWLTFPLKWLTSIVGAITIWWTFAKKASAARTSPLVSTAPAARPLAVKSAGALWTGTTVATGLATAGIVITGSASAIPSLIRNINVVTTEQTVGQPETQEIYMMKADGKQLRQLTHNGRADFEPDLFADQRIVFTSDRKGNNEIYVMNADGTGQTRLTYNPGYDACPDWSPDGTRIAFTSTRSGSTDIYIMNADGSRPTRITNDGATDWCPDWSPDGKQIAFTSDRNGIDNVYVMKADGTGVIQLTTGGGSRPKWSPDMTSIAFTSNRDGNQNVYVVGSDGSKETRLTDDPGNDRLPFWAPDGSGILFWSERGLTGGREEVYLMNPDGSDVRRLTHFNNA